MNWFLYFFKRSLLYFKIHLQQINLDSLWISYYQKDSYAEMEDLKQDIIYAEKELLCLRRKIAVLEQTRTSSERQ